MAQTPSRSLVFGIGLRQTGEVVDLQVATATGEIGGVFVPEQRGLDLDPATGSLTLLPASDNRLGGLFDVPAVSPDKSYVRKYAQWVEADPAAAMEYRVGLLEHLDPQGQSLGIVDLKVAGTNGEIGGVFPFARNGINNGLDFDSATGAIWAPPATDQLLGTITEPPEAGKQYARERDAATGVNAWVEVEAGGIGDVPPDPPIVWGRATGRWMELPGAVTYETGLVLQGTEVHVTPATDSDLGGVFVPDGQGLALQTSGQLTLVPTTDSQLGGIVDAPFNSRPHVRQDATWVEAEAIRPAGDSVDKIGVVYIPDDRGLDIGPDGRLTLFPASDNRLGGMFDVPAVPPDKSYVRKYAQWVEASASGVLVQDTPPASAPANALWWDSDSGDLFINYQDMDSAQWVQVNSSGGGSASGDYVPLDGSVPMTGQLQADAGIKVSIGQDTWLGADLRFSTMPPTGSYGEIIQLKNAAGDKVMWNTDSLTQVVNFMVPPVCLGIPIVLATDLNAANERIARLEERLARLEGRTP